jgi:hypothetical protein
MRVAQLHRCQTGRSPESPDPGDGGWLPHSPEFLDEDGRGVPDGCARIFRAVGIHPDVNGVRVDATESLRRHVCCTDDEPVDPGVLGGLVEVQAAGEASLRSDWRPAHAEDLADIGERAETGGSAKRWPTALRSKSA